jgi:hypothetical protein
MLIYKYNITKERLQIMKVKIYENSKKNNDMEAHVLLEDVQIVYCNIAKPDEGREFSDGKYNCTVLLPKKGEQTKQLMALLDRMSLKNNNFKIKPGTQYYPLKSKDLEDIKRKLDAETDEKKKAGYAEYLKIATDNYLMKLSSNYEIRVVDLKGNDVDNLETVKFHMEFVNIQFKITQPKDKSYFSRFLQGVQLKEVVRFEATDLFSYEEDQNGDIGIEEKDDELPF